MDMNQTPSANRVHISFFGVRNAGKSSVMNAVTGQSIAVVSDVKGTTTDPVIKSMELLPLGPVTVIDTPGLDDTGSLGALRVEKTMQVLRKTDIAVLIADAAYFVQHGFRDTEKEILKMIAQRALPHVIALNKADILQQDADIALPGNNAVLISAATGSGIFELKEKLAHLTQAAPEKFILKDLVQPRQTAVLVIPIDKAAPKGRLILPQQQVIRELLDIGACAVMTQDDNLDDTLHNLKEKPAIVITDSQAFGKVSSIVPDDVPLTSFSILFARYKGNLQRQLTAVRTLDSIEDGDEILISEGCTHHRQCDDIGTVKLPGWIRAYTKAQPHFSFTSGGEFPQDLSKYKMVIHCGACMLNEKEMRSRLKTAQQQGVPMSNYGMVIAYTHGILKRSLCVFPDLK